MPEKRRRFENGPPYRVEHYINLKNKRGEMYYDAKRLHMLQEYNVTVSVPENYVCTDVRVVWYRIWLHDGGRFPGGIDALTTGDMDSAYIRCGEEVGYERNLAAFQARMDKGSPNSFETDYRDFLIEGAYKHLYILDRTGYWGKDLYDECRFRQTDNVLKGWHNLEYNHMLYEHRQSMYLHLPLNWYHMFECPRLLAVPNPWIMMYATDYYNRADKQVRGKMEQIMHLEYVAFYVLRMVYAAEHGIVHNPYPDKRFSNYKRGVYGGRLFNIAPGVVEILATIHPFYFIESMGVDPVLAFLAVRRALEVSVIDGDCVQYDWETGETEGFPEEYAKDEYGHDTDSLLYPVTTRNVVTAMTRKEEAAEAWLRFKKLTEGHKGKRAKVQFLMVVSNVMNHEGYGVESPGLTSKRRAREAGQPWGKWKPPTKCFDDEVQAELDAFKTVVSALPEEDEHGTGHLTCYGLPSHPLGTVDRETRRERGTDPPNYSPLRPQNIERRGRVTSMDKSDAWSQAVDAEGSTSPMVDIAQPNKQQITPVVGSGSCSERLLLSADHVDKIRDSLYPLIDVSSSSGDKTIPEEGITNSRLRTDVDGVLASISKLHIGEEETFISELTKGASILHKILVENDKRKDDRIQLLTNSISEKDKELAERPSMDRVSELVENGLEEVNKKVTELQAKLDAAYSDRTDTIGALIVLHEELDLSIGQSRQSVEKNAEAVLSSIETVRQTVRTVSQKKMLAERETSRIKSVSQGLLDRLEERMDSLVREARSELEDGKYNDGRSSDLPIKLRGKKRRQETTTHSPQRSGSGLQE